jgi:hypothetical protein
MRALKSSLFSAGLIVLAGVHGAGQEPSASAIVAQFYPQSLVQLAESSGEPYTRQQCFAVYDTNTAGSPQTIVAAYTNHETAAIRVLQAGPSGFTVVADPQGLELAGFQCEVSLVDLDSDGRKEVRVDFSAGANTITWLFKWTGQDLINVTPTTPAPASGHQTSTLIGAQLLDVDNDGVKKVTHCPLLA